MGITLPVLLLFVGCSLAAEIGKRDVGILGDPLAVQRDESQLADTICMGTINQARASNGKGPVSTNAQVEEAANKHNSLMLSTNCFSHQCSGEPALGDRLTATGYRWGGAGEIIAKGQKNCGEAVNAWLNSPGHKDIMLGNFVHVGCSGLTNSEGAGPYWTCVFARPL